MRKSPPSEALRYVVLFPSSPHIAHNTLTQFFCADAPDAPAVIINGASSSVGAFAVQLAKRAGLFVVGVAGASKDYAKSLGADIVLDYREYKSADALVSLTHRNLTIRT